MKKTVKILSYGIAVLGALLVFPGCSDMGSGGSADGGGDSGHGGSMARFTIVGDYMYTVDYGTLKVVSLKFPDKPFEVDGMSIGFNIETIFSMDDYLFIGSQSAMYIYDIGSPEAPKKVGMARHFNSCDPVVASGDYAYVTLNSTVGSWCGSRGNVLQVYDITDIQDPVRKKEISMRSPRGLAVDGDAGLLFVCDDGLVKAYKITEPTTGDDGIEVERAYSTSDILEVRGMNAYDCIARDGRLTVTGDDGIFLLTYDAGGFGFLGKIDLR